MQNDPSQSFSLSNIEGLIRRLESLPDPEARATAAELIGTVLRFYNLALNHIVKELMQMEFGPKFIEEITHDSVVSNLFLLHGLHPLRSEVRVRAGLQRVELYWKSAGYELEGLEVADANLHIQFQKVGADGGSTLALRSLVENAIYNAAPEIQELRIEGLEENQPPSPRRTGFVPLSKLLNDLATSRAKSSGSEKQDWQ
jgi:hypothetical protein